MSGEGELRVTECLTSDEALARSADRPLTLASSLLLCPLAASSSTDLAARSVWLEAREDCTSLSSRLRPVLVLCSREMACSASESWLWRCVT